MSVAECLSVYATAATIVQHLNLLSSIVVHIGAVVVEHSALAISTLFCYVPLFPTSHGSIRSLRLCYAAAAAQHRGSTTQFCTACPLKARG